MLGLSGLFSTNADDTDIYLTNNASSIDKPLIMFSLDYRASLGNSVCSDNEDTAADGVCGQLVEEGYLPGNSIKDNGNYSSLEIYRAVLKKVMDHELSPGFSIKQAAKFGIMMNHADKSGCNAGDPTCSDGGFMLSGFRDLSVVTDYNFFFGALDSIPIPNQSWNDVFTNTTNTCSAYGSNTGTHDYQGTELFFEFFRYLTGQDVYFGQNGADDFGTDDDQNLNSTSDLMAVPVSATDASCKATPNWDPSIQPGAVYDSPLAALDPNGCGSDIYTFNFMFGVSAKDQDADDAIAATRADGGLDNLNVSSSSRFEDVLSFLHDVDLGTTNQFGTVGPLPGKQNVTSYFFVPTTKVNNTTNGYAAAGGTSNAIGMDLTDVDAVIDILTGLLGEVLNVSTTFVSPTLPTNVFNRTDLLDQVYLGIFKADEDFNPRWTGNLKKLYLNTDDPEHHFLVGDNGSGSPSATAAEAADGRISPTTLTGWTHPEDVPTPIDILDSDYGTGTDGRSTVHGGAGGNIPGYRSTYEPGLVNNSSVTTESSSRIVFTEPDSRSSSTLRALNADDATATEMLQIGNGGTNVATIDDDYKEIKINLWRTIMPFIDCSGYDPTNGILEPTNCDNYNVAQLIDQTLGINRMKDILAYNRGYTEFGGVKRSWIMGDPLHSRPAAINYGGATEDSQVIRLAITSNDGFLHFFRASDGVEDWAFSPRAVTKVQHRLQQNTLALAPIHPYTLDSTPVVLKIDHNNNGLIEVANGDKVYLFVGMRRGGDNYYALDVSDYNSPKMLWSINSGDADFSELGQTWSEPQPISVTYNNNGTTVSKLALIFGGGYNGDDDGDGSDLGKDARDTDSAFSGSNDDEGNAIYIVDAETGALIWNATGDPSAAGSTSERVYFHTDMLDSIPSKVLALNVTNPNDDYYDRAYAGDTGGVMWRVDFNSTNRADWKVSRLADLGRHDTPADQTNDRRFFHSADVALSNDQYGSFDGIVVASGNRSHPLTDSTDNYLYLIKDRNVNATPGSENPFSHSDFQDLTDNCLQDNDASDCSGYDSLNSTLPALEAGWKVKLELCADPTATGSCGEKGLSEPFVFLGNINFNSYIPTIPDPNATTCAPDEGSGEKYRINLQTAAAVEDFNSSNNANGVITLDRNERLRSGGIPGGPTPTGRSYDSAGSGTGSPGTGASSISNCEERIGLLYPDLSVELICTVGLIKKYWYTN